MSQALSNVFKLHDVINVKDPAFGAKGDGVTNDSAAFQLAVNALPTQGGLIIVPPGDYSATTGASVTAGSKKVIWLAHGAIMPTGLPGSVVTTGEKTLKTTNRTSDKTGNVFYHAELKDRIVPTDRLDNVFYVTGNLPASADVTQRELIAYGFSLETNHVAPNGGDIRGVKGFVRGNGGGANIRAVHVIAEGFNGHTGNLTGVLADVDHSDKTDGVFDPTPDAIAVVGSLGAGTSAGFAVRSRTVTKQRPSYGYYLPGGADAVLPNTACFSAHGGGVGDLYDGRTSDTDTTVIFRVDNKAKVQAKSYFSGKFTSIADDAAVTIVPPANNVGTIEFWTNGTGGWGKAYFRTSGAGSDRMDSIYAGANVAYSTLVLTGTTGTDGKLTVSMNSGTIYVENRVGTAAPFYFTFKSHI